MKQSTCRYFHRENELPLRWKSTRRDATSAGARPSAASTAAERQRQRRHRDAVRIVRVDDVRRQPLDQTRESRHAAERSISVRGASGIELEPLGGAPPQLAVRVRDERGALADRPQAVDGQQDLVLPAAPGPRGVDVEREHQACIASTRLARH